MPHPTKPSESLKQPSNISITSTNSFNQSRANIIVWIIRLVLFIVLLLFIIPIALVLTPWWIFLQPCKNACPNIMNGYYRIVTWPLKLSKNIRFYRIYYKFIEQLKY
ncbi:unnamed protein product [Rotaria magnacalcarata]|uniref:Uncharacterized protein n=1 Tax=Rotaria magnacalcarata TaxID=392030 RepID=A0A820FYR5_9BILA|nr:unnamed protein product [Rotaria magnacalcarata]CAF2029957.1 unnamed protein product [Rotaria magnacalcarata]CAF2104719.1 unnamed protein product [Rotaria magnacalcarata]CAF2239357.1 unnamed protein product [Rotaria magnacalcarata]CAF4270064.1 unnamed protein product [Rotaria magnacalcarata]